MLQQKVDASLEQLAHAFASKLENINEMLFMLDALQDPIYITG